MNATEVREELDTLELRIKLLTMKMDILKRQRQELLNKLKPNLSSSATRRARLDIHPQK